MVRLKERYLLVQILYPSNLPRSTATSNQDATTSSAPKPNLLSPNAPSTSSLLTLYKPTPDTVNIPIILRTIRAQITGLFGEHGAAITSNGLSIKYWSNATSSFVVRCRRDVVRMVWAAVTFVRSLPVSSGHEERGGPHGAGRRGQGWIEEQIECVLRIVHVSGTMRKCEEEAVRKARGMLGRARGLAEVKDAGADVERLMGVDREGFGGNDGELHGHSMDVDEDDEEGGEV